MKTALTLLSTAIMHHLALLQGYGWVDATMLIMISLIVIPIAFVQDLKEIF